MSSSKEAIDVSVMDSKEYEQVAGVCGSKRAHLIAELDNTELKAISSKYHVDKRREFDGLKAQEAYANALLAIKDIKRAEADRIKPEKILFELAMVLLAPKPPENLRETKQYKKAIKSSGKDYTNEFVRKNPNEIKEFCIRFYTMKQQVQDNLLANDKYQGARNLKAKEEGDIKEGLRAAEVESKLATLILKDR